MVGNLIVKAKSLSNVSKQRINRDYSANNQKLKRLLNRVAGFFVDTNMHHPYKLNKDVRGDGFNPTHIKMLH